MYLSTWLRPISVSHNKLRPRLAAADNIPVSKVSSHPFRINVGNGFLTVIFILINPTVTLFRLNHELVISEPCIDECVDEGAS